MKNKQLIQYFNKSLFFKDHTQKQQHEKSNPKYVRLCYDEDTRKTKCLTAAVKLVFP